MNTAALDLSPLALHRRISEVEEHTAAMLAWKQSVEENTQANKENVEIQKEMLIVGKNLIATLKVLGWVGSAAKWVSRIGVAAGIMWGLIKGIPHIVP